MGTVSFDGLLHAQAPHAKRQILTLLPRLSFGNREVEGSNPIAEDAIRAAAGEKIRCGHIYFVFW